MESWKGEKSPLKAKIIWSMILSVIQDRSEDTDWGQLLHKKEKHTQSPGFAKPQLETCGWGCHRMCPGRQPLWFI